MSCTKRNYRSEIMLLVCIFTILLSAAVTGVQFSFIPSQAITIQQTAVYKCSVDNNVVSIQWNVNGLLSTDPFITDLGIITYGVGAAATQNSTLTIPGYPELNNTNVTCLASGIVDTMVYVNSSNATLFIQGKPDPVDLTCVISLLYTIQCNWNNPYTIPEFTISKYNINITNEEELVKQVSFDTQYTYNVSRFGTYTISIRAVISEDLEGERNESTVNIETVHITDHRIGIRNQSGYWMINTTIRDTILMNPQPSGIYVCITELNDESGSCVYNRTGIITQYSPVITGEINVGFLNDNKRLSVNTVLMYESGLEVVCNEPKNLSTLRGDAVVQDSTKGRVCFTCIFVEGSQSLGCFIEYLCTRIEYNGQLNINSSLGSQNVSKCIDGIYTSDYDISFYDIEQEGVINYQSAYQLIQHSIDGLSPPIMSSSPLSSSPLSSSLPSLSQTSTTISQTPTDSPTIDAGPSLIVIVIPVAVIVIVTVVIIIIVIVIVVVIKGKRKHLKPSVTVMYYDDTTINENKSNDELNTVDSTVHSNAPTLSSPVERKRLPLNYADVDPTIQPDAPIPPLPIELKPVTYKEVLHNQPQEQQYSTIGPSNNPLVNNVQVDGEEYSKLNHDVHAKSMQSLHSEGYGKLQHPRTDFTTPQHQSTIGGYSTLPLNSKSQTQNEQSITLPGQISSPERNSPETYDHNPQLTYKFLMDHILSEIPHKWYEFGSALAITPPQMEEIKENHPSNENRAFADVIQIWQTEKTRPFTWETLMMVLGSSTVNESQLVQQLIELNKVSMKSFNY